MWQESSNTVGATSRWGNQFHLGEKQRLAEDTGGGVHFQILISVTDRTSSLDFRLCIALFLPFHVTFRGGQPAQCVLIWKRRVHGQGAWDPQGLGLVYDQDKLLNSCSRP